jgi:integrase
LLALQWSDLDLQTGSLDISKSLEQTKAGLRVKSTKSEEPRCVALPEWALEVLQEHRAEQENDRATFGRDYVNNALIFCQPAGRYYSPDRVGARVAELMRKVGLQGVSLHSLRHSHASILLSKGVPISVVSERLGHADQNITLSIYSHALPADSRAAAKIWNDSMAEVISSTPVTVEPPKKTPACLPEPLVKNVSLRKIRKEFGGDDGARTRDLRRDRRKK